MKTKFLKIGLIALAFTFVFTGSSWATNKHRERKPKKTYHKRTYHGDHVKKRYNDARHWRHGGGHRRHYYKKRHHRYYHPFLEYRRHHEHRYYRPYHYRYRHHHYRKYHHYRRHHRRIDHHHSNNGAFIIGSVFEPGWGFTFATKRQY